MRQSESDGEGGWEQPRDYISPWAPRDEDRHDGYQSGYEDQAGYGNQDRYGQAWYGNQGGYQGQSGDYQAQQGSGEAGAHQTDGFGTPGWASLTFTVVAPSITWLLVSTRPEDEMIIPVPSAVSPLYLSVEVMSTRPGSTLFATADRLSVAEEDPLPAALLPGPGTSWEENPGAGEALWRLTATVTPAPMPAASAATAI